MSPPNQDKQENRGEETKYGVEEEGGTCPDPALHQESSERRCKAVLFMQAPLGEFAQILKLCLYLMFGTEGEIDKQFIKIKEFEETKNPPGIPQIAFPESTVVTNGRNGPHMNRTSPDDPKDNILFPLFLCGKIIKLKVEVDNNTCYLQLHISSQVIEDIKVKSTNCLAGTQAEDMRLHGPKVPAFLSFSLLCNKSQILTPMNITLNLTAVDERGYEICNHMVKKQFSVCFYDKHANSKNNPNLGNYLPLSTDKKTVLEDNHCKVCQKIKNWLPFIQWFVTNGVLDKRFLEYDELSEERKGEILRHLYTAENIFPKFIEALRHSDNEELADYLLQYIASMGNQNSSL